MRRFNLQAAEFKYDESDPDGYRSGMVRLGPLLGAAETGMSIYEIPARQSICPYHYEWAEEEWLVVLEGAPALRHPDGEDTARVLMFSTVTHPAVSVYPDGDKIGIWTGGDRSDDVLVRRESAVGYYDREA